LIYPYYPAYHPFCYHFVISVDNSGGIFADNSIVIITLAAYCCKMASNSMISAISKSKTSAIANQPAISSVCVPELFVCTTSKQKVDSP